LLLGQLSRNESVGKGERALERTNKIKLLDIHPRKYCIQVGTGSSQVDQSIRKHLYEEKEQSQKEELGKRSDPA